MNRVPIFFLGLLSLLSLVQLIVSSKWPALDTSGKSIAELKTHPVTSQKSLLNGTFMLPAAARTSAGVYNKVTGVLVRTIWSNRQTAAGAVIVPWDGKDDFGAQQPPGEYVIKLLASQVAYTWMGVLGNSSTDINHQQTMQRSFTRIKALHIEGQRAYYGVGYAEGHPSQAYFHVNTPQKRIEFFPNGKTGQCTKLVVSDGKLVYWAGYDFFSEPTKNLNFIFATKVSDNTLHTFASGKAVSTANGAEWGYRYPSCLIAERAALPKNTDLYTGLAVQRAGTYLFVAEGTRHTIRVYHKLTGAFIRDIPTTSPGALAVDISHDNSLWVVENNVLSQRTILPDGSLGPATIKLPHLVKPMAMGISPDGKTIAVCDGDTSQRVKGYSTATGALTWLMGVKGGYYKDPGVSVTKFYFDDVSLGINDTYLTYAPDGSFWVGDNGNYRSLHFTSNRSYLEQIAYLENCYSTSVDQNDASRLFAQYLEFSVSDYDKPVTAWKLVKNYRATVPADYFGNDYSRMQGIFITDVFRNAVTIKGHTYALLRKPRSKTVSVVELLPDAPLRFTGITLNDAPWVLGPDGSLGLQTVKWTGSVGKATWKRQPLLEIATTGNPVWGLAQIIQTASVTANDPIDYSGYGEPFALTTSGKLITFLSGLYDPETGRGLGYHLGGFEHNRRSWGTHLATSPNYRGDYPRDGAYDIGNDVKYGGGNCSVVGNHIFPTYHGENWKNGQVNKFTHWYENGLMVGDFGVTQAEAEKDPATFRGMAGNVFGATGIRSNNGNIYLVHGEEFGWSGLHIWRVSNLSSVLVQTREVTLNAGTDVPAVRLAQARKGDVSGSNGNLEARGVAILSGLPRNASVPNGQYGVVRSPAADHGQFSIRTNVYSYQRHEAPDLTLSNDNEAGDKFVRVSLGAFNGLKKWQLSFRLQATQYYPSVGEYGEPGSGGGYIRIRDAAGKILVQYAQKIKDHSTVILANGVQVATIPGNTPPAYAPINIRLSDGVMLFTYAGYRTIRIDAFDAAATLGSPASIEIFSWIDSRKGNNTGRIYSISDAWFKPSA